MSAMEESINPLSARGNKRYLIIGGVIGFAIAAALALIIGLSTGIRHSDAHHRPVDPTILPLNPDLVANYWPEILYAQLLIPYDVVVMTTIQAPRERLNGALVVLRSRSVHQFVR